MSTELSKMFDRDLPRTTDSKGNPLVARMAPEGVYLKCKGERWTSAYFVSWDSIYWMGVKSKAQENKTDNAIARAVRRKA